LGSSPSVTLAKAFDRCLAVGALAGVSRDVARALNSLTEAARGAWPKVTVADEEWARHLAERVDRKAVLASLEALDAAGLYLTCACLTGSDVALAAFDAELRGAPKAALQRLHLDDAGVDEVLQRLRQRLLLGVDGSRGLSHYSGRGRLSAWLRISAVRIASDLRSEKQPVADSEERLLSMAVETTPEIAASRAELREHFRTAFRTALASLTARQRSLLSLSIVEGLGIDRIAPVFGSSRATIARWLAQAKAALAEQTRIQLQDRLQLASEDLDLLMASVRSCLTLSLARALQDRAR